MITIEFLGCYWTVSVAGRPLMTFASFERAVAFVRAS